MADYTIAKRVACMCSLQGWQISHLDFENVFHNGPLDCPVHVELPKYVYSVYERIRSVMRLNRSLYGVKSAAWTWDRLIFSELKILDYRSYAARRAYLEKRICFWYAIRTISSFSDQRERTKAFRDQMIRVFRTEGLGKPAQLLGI